MIYSCHCGRKENFMEKFRFWCQKVLPLVYDDSLSYYELLCKVVKYLNTLADNLNNTNTQITELAKQFNELKNYVDNYFGELDITGEIDSKIQELQNSGYFESLVNIDKFNDFTSSVDNSISGIKNDFETYKKQVDNIIDSIQLGSPSGSFSNIQELTSAYPDGGSGFYVVGSEWYYWNGSAWVSGGNWNAQIIGKHSIEPINIKGSKVFEYTSRDYLVDGSYINTDGVIVNNPETSRFVVDVTPNGYTLFIGHQKPKSGLIAFLNDDVVVNTVDIFNYSEYDILNRRFLLNEPIDGFDYYNNLLCFVLQTPSNANKVSINGFLSPSFPDFRDITYIGDFDLDALSNFLFGYSDIFSEEIGKAYITALSNNSQFKILNGMSYGLRNGDTYNVILADNYYMFAYPLKKGVTYSVARAFGTEGYGKYVLWNRDGTVTVVAPEDLASGLNVVLSDGSTRVCGLITPEQDCIITGSTGEFGVAHPSAVLSDTFIGFPLYDNFPTKPYVQELNNYALLPSYRETPENVLKGVKISVIGDSITEKNHRANTNWVNYFENIGAVMQNLGKSGTGFINPGSVNNRYIDRIENINSDVELIGVSVSFNDVPNYNVGLVTDTSADNTILGYANDFFKALLTKFPTIPIVCYTTNPWKNIRYGGDNVYSSKAVALISGIEELCKQNGIGFKSIFNSTVLRPWIDENNSFFFNSDGTLTPDGTHPNSKGHMVLFKEYLPLFMEHYRTSNDFYK